MKWKEAFVMRKLNEKNTIDEKHIKHPANFFKMTNIRHLFLFFGHSTGQDVSYNQIDIDTMETDTNIVRDAMSRQVEVKQVAHMYIYYSNEESSLNYEAFFDDFTVTHTKSPVIQAEDYYPFGLVATSYRRENSLEQSYLTQGQELQNELDLGWYDFGARMYNPALGRWNHVDPMADAAPNLTPYRYAFNNPVRFIDPDGVFETANDMVQDAWNKTSVVLI